MMTVMHRIESQQVHLLFQRAAISKVCYSDGPKELGFVGISRFRVYGRVRVRVQTVGIVDIWNSRLESAHYYTYHDLQDDVTFKCVYWVGGSQNTAKN